MSDNNRNNNDLGVAIVVSLFFIWLFVILPMLFGGD